MSMTDAAEQAFLSLLFNNQAWTGIGDAGGLLPSALEGNLYVSLHTASPGESGDQTTNEATYTGYARVATPRNATDWAVAGNLVDNVNAIIFGTCTAGSDVITHWGIGTDLTGVGNLLVYGAVAVAFSVVVNTIPQFNIGDLDVSAD